jgi:hypothetical protein
LDILIGIKINLQKISRHDRAFAGKATGRSVGTNAAEQIPFLLSRQEDEILLLARLPPLRSFYRRGVIVSRRFEIPSA